MRVSNIPRSKPTIHNIAALAALLTLPYGNVMADYTITVPPGYSAIANHLNNGGNTLAELFPDVPNGTQIFKWNCTSYEAYTKAFGNWSSNATLVPGEGAFIRNRQSTDLTITFTGTTVPLPILLPPSSYCGCDDYSLMSCQQTNAATYEMITGMSPAEGVQVFRWSNPASTPAYPPGPDFIEYTFSGGNWTSPNGAPVLNVGESAFFRVHPPCCQAFNTGMSRPSGDVPLAAGEVDPSFILVSSPTGEGTTAVVTGYIPPNWLQNPTNSQWIASGTNTISSAGGIYHYQLHFLLCCTNVQLVGRMAADNSAGLFLNNQPVGTVTNFWTWTTINLVGGFVQGDNILDIYVTNAGISPSGLRAELTVCQKPLTLTCASDKTVECGQSWTFDQPSVYAPCCTNEIIPSLISSNLIASDPPCWAVYEGVWWAMDCCSNFASCTQIVTVVDRTGPLLTYSNKTVECGNTWSFDVPSAWDACCGTNVAVWLGSTNLVLANLPCEEVWQAIWWGRDCCSNYTTCTQTVTVVDTVPPIFTSQHCATNIYPAGTTDEFVGPEPSSPSVGLTNRLRTQYNAQFKGFDNCTNDQWVAHTFSDLPPCTIVAATLTIHVMPCGGEPTNDSVSLSFTGPDGNLLTTNGYWGSLIGPSSLLANPWNATFYPTGALITLNLANLSPGLDLLPYLNAYRFLDFTCQDDSSVDYVELTVVSCCCVTNQTVECGSAWSFDEPTAWDVCCGTNVTVWLASSNMISGDPPCLEVWQGVWWARDCCSNYATCTQTVTVVDSTPPLLNCSNKTVECGGAWSFDAPTAWDLCCGTNVTVWAESTNWISGHPPCEEVWQVVWRARDCCSNYATCTQTVTVLDTLPPLLICSNRTVECSNAWSFDEPFAWDECCGTNVTVWLESTNLVSNDPPCQEVWQAVWWARDCCSNYVTCTQTVTVILGDEQTLELYNTGVDDNGALLAGGAVDPHYVLDTNPNGGGNQAFVVYSNSTVFQAWLPNDATSQWIAPTTNGIGAGGAYCYRMSFTLCTNAENVTITGRWAADNDGTMVLNTNTAAPVATLTGGVWDNFATWHEFTITSGFVDGLNNLDFWVTNTSGYTGLRVELSGTACCCTIVNPPVEQTYTIGISNCCSLIANQLDKPGGNTLDNIMPVLPVNCRFMKYNNDSGTWSTTTYSTAGGWADGSITLNPGEGAFLCPCCPTNFDLTFTGLPHTPALPVTIPAGTYYLLSRQTNDVGTYEDIVGTTPPNGAKFIRWDGSNCNYFMFARTLGTWTGGATPTAAVGEAVWIGSPGTGNQPPIPPESECPTNRVGGYKFNDLNGNGIWETNEPPLANWPLHAYDEAAILVASTVTGPDGRYFFDLPCGIYTVREGSASNWVQTYPTSGYYVVTATGSYTNLNFGNQATNCCEPPWNPDACCTNCYPPYLVTNTVTVWPGYNFLVNPLCHGTNNTVGAVLPNVADQSQLMKWNVALQTFDSPLLFDSGFGGWVDQFFNDASGTPLPPGDGFLLVNPGTSYVLTFVGCQPDPACKRCRPTNVWWLVGAMGVGQTNATWADVFRCAPECGTRLQIWNGTDYDTYTYLNGGWDPVTPNWAASQSVFVSVHPDPRCCTNELGIQCGVPAGGMVVTNDPGRCDAVVYYPPPVVSGGCSTNISTYCVPPSGSVFPVGTTSVTCSASNGIGQVAHCTFPVTVLDLEPPVLICGTNRVVPCGTNWAFDVPLISDNCCASNTLTVIVTNTVVTNSEHCETVFTRTWEVTDCHSNTASCSQTVTVVRDIPAPVIIGYSLEGTTFHLTFATETCVRYIVEYKDNLTTPAWVTLVELDGDGTVHEVVDGPLQHMRFYRIRAVCQTEKAQPGP